MNLRVSHAWACAALALVACAGVLGLRDPQPMSFPHRAHVTRGIACTTCHRGLERAGDDAALHLPDDASCTTAGCHATPHDRGACLGCHSDPVAVGAAGEARAHLRFAHDRHLERTRGNCMRCHSGVADGDQRLRPEMQTCYRCHDEHRDARACGACHRDLADTETAPASHLTHDGDWLHEHGARASSSAELCATCHQQSFCADCHGTNVAALPSRLAFDDPFRASVHRAGFRSRHAIEARTDPGVCSTCHTPSACATCHQREGVAPASGGAGGGLSPHPVGWIGLTRASDQHGRAARADPASCAGCHGGAGESLCVRCHQVGGVGGNPHPAGWSSRQPMSALPCRLCHAGGLR